MQPLPGADEQSIRFAENSIKNYSNLSARIAENGAEGILEDFPKRSVQTCTGIRFQCRCSREKALSAVLSMGKQEAFNLCKELGKVTVHCPDCNTDYEFTEKEITGIFE